MAVAVVKFIGNMIISYAVSRAVTDVTGNKTLGMVAGALTSYGMSSAMSGAASAGSTGATSTAGDVAANSSASAAAPAAAEVGSGTVLQSGASGATTTGASSAAAGTSAGATSGASGGLLSKAWDGAKSYAASDAGKKLIAETVVGGVKGYAETKQAEKEADRLIRFRSEESEKDRAFKARHDGAVADPSLYRSGTHGERFGSGFLDDKHGGLLSMYEQLYNKEK